MVPDETARLTALKAGELDVLVATTVIEVGVDVPEATMMVAIPELDGRIISVPLSFKDRAECVVNQFNGFEVETGLPYFLADAGL